MARRKGLARKRAASDERIRLNPLLGVMAFPEWKPAALERIETKYGPDIVAAFGGAKVLAAALWLGAGRHHGFFDVGFDDIPELADEARKFLEQHEKE